LGKDNVTAPRALALSDKQLALLQRAAASLPVGERDHFLQSVAAHLTGAPTDDAVTAVSMSPLLFRRSFHGRAGVRPTVEYELHVEVLAERSLMRRCATTQ
jgi:hypothetical protein